MDEIIFLTHFDHMYPPNDIHGWKAMDKSFLMVFLKKNYIDPTGRQNFGDAPGQIPKLILTLCLKLVVYSCLKSKRDCVCIVMISFNSMTMSFLCGISKIVSDHLRM